MKEGFISKLLNSNLQVVFNLVSFLSQFYVLLVTLFFLCQNRSLFIGV